MNKGFGSIHAAAGMKNYLERKVRSEIERTKPGPRNASVVSIDRERKKCEVRYPGEEGTVWVPYGSIEPVESNNIKVKIDGPIGERRIVEVYGKTRTTSRIEHLEAERFVPTLWSMSLGKWAESFPLMMINTESTWPDAHDNSGASCSPLVIPRDMHISRIEAKIRVEAIEGYFTSEIRIALHKIDLDDREIIYHSEGPPEVGDHTFNLKYIDASPRLSGVVSGNHWRISHRLSEPVAARAGDVYVISVASYNTSSEPRFHPTFERLRHPTVPLAYGRHQFMRGSYPKNFMDRDVARSEFTNSLLNETLWVAAFPGLQEDEEEEA